MDHPDEQPDVVGQVWLDTVQKEAVLVVRAEAAAEGHALTDEQIRMAEIGILAGARQMLDLLFDLSGVRPPSRS